MMMDNRISKLRNRRYRKMSLTDLDRLNGKLIGKGHNWCTQERWDVTREISIRFMNALTDKNEWYLKTNASQ